MTINNKVFTNGFIIAGLMNLTVLIFSRFFTNEVIPETDPIVMSNFGILMIAIWGLAYISVAKSYQNVKWLVGVFVVEKLVYAIAWINWMMNNNVSEVFAKDAMAGIFFSIYGVNDSIFCLFFLTVFAKLLKSN